jgi:hypothetical protein
MRARHVTLGILAALAAAQVVLGTLSLARHIGEVRRDGDTFVFLGLSGDRPIPRDRAVLYPKLIGAADWLRGHQRSLPEFSESPWDHPDATQGLLGIQIAQLLLCVASLAYFLRAILDWSQLGRFRRVGFALALGLLALDPLVLHFALAIMTDSPALSASLVFCAALGNLGRRRTPMWAAGALLLGAQIVAGGLRMEKNLVMLATAGASAILFAWAARRGLGSRGLVRRGLVALLLSSVAFVATLTGQRWVHGESEPGFAAPDVLILNQRFVFPHLAEIYDALPESARQRLDRRQAQGFDVNLVYIRPVLYNASGGDPSLARELTHDFVRTALAERGGSIALDIAKDWLENVLSSLSFYTRLGARVTLELPVYRAHFRHGGAGGTYRHLRMFAPRLAHAQLAVAALLLLVGAGAALVGWRALGRRGEARAHGDFTLAWAPVGAFWLANSAAFAFTQDFVIVRYTLFSHVAILSLVTFGALRWALGGAETGPAVLGRKLDS